MYTKQPLSLPAVEWGSHADYLVPLPFPWKLLKGIGSSCKHLHLVPGLGTERVPVQHLENWPVMLPSLIVALGSSASCSYSAPLLTEEADRQTDRQAT